MKQNKVFNWHVEPKQEENKVLLYIYDDVTEFGNWNWEIWDYEESETSAKHFRDVLNTIPDGVEIELHINSNGGSVKEGTAIYNLLSQKANHKTVIVDGVAHSIAFLIVQAGDDRIMMPGTTALFHNMWMVCAGNAKELRKFADDLDTMMEANRKVFASRATISEEEIKDLMEAETYLTPDTALEYGLIDRIGVITAGEEEHESTDLTEQLRKELSELRQQFNERSSLRDVYLALTEQTRNLKPEENTEDDPNEDVQDKATGNPMMDFFNKLVEEEK